MDKTMKSIRSLLLALMLVGPASAAEPTQGPPIAGPDTTINAAAHYVDSIFTNALAALELIAATPEARGRDWDGIKRYLKQVEARLPGVYFFVLPDGNYYSVARDYTQLNLSDREYFASLFAGNQVKGFPIHSRSSGKKSALMAAPIVVDNVVVGALGASVFLDDLYARLNQDLALPAGYTWFVLDAAGKTMLHKDGDYIFMNALTQGSRSLQQAVSEALQGESGEMRYELGGVRHAHYRKLPGMGWWMVLARIEGGEVQTPALLNLSLDRFVQDLQRRLDRIDGSVAKSIQEHRLKDRKEREIRELLGSIIDQDTDLVSASYVDDTGIVRHMEPSDYRNLENADVSTQEHVIAMLKTREPVFSRGFSSIEGFQAVDLARPLFDENNNFIGSIGVLFRPELLIDSLLETSVTPPDYELWIMQTDGLMIFDSDTTEIGRMLFRDPMYADYSGLLNLGKTIVSETAGKGSYIFLAPGTKENVIKNVAWQTVGLHGREWRVALAYRPYEQPSPGGQDKQGVP